MTAPLTAATSSAEGVAPPWLSSATMTGDHAPSARLPSSDAIEGNYESEVHPDVPRMIMYTRIINLVLSLLMIIVSSLSLLMSSSATTGVLGCYVIAFSCLLCCYETHLKQVSKVIALNFGFLYSARSRVLFMVFIGTIMFSFDYFFAFILGLTMFANAGFNIYIIFRYPGYEEAQRESAESELQDLFKNNPAFAQKALVFGLGAAAAAGLNNQGGADNKPPQTATV